MCIFMSRLYSLYFKWSQPIAFRLNKTLNKCAIFFRSLAHFYLKQKFLSHLLFFFAIFSLLASLFAIQHTLFFSISINFVLVFGFFRCNLSLIMTRVMQFPFAFAQNPVKLSNFIFSNTDTENE